MATKGFIEDLRTMERVCLDCIAKEEAERTAAETILGLQKELDFVREQHAQTLARKSNVMQDWLADQKTKWQLRCQLREHGHEPIK